MAGLDKSYFLDGKPSTMVEVNQAIHAGTELRRMLPLTCVRVFVAGAVTHVGKTSVCLGLLAALRKAGFAANELAYIKPATQCEAPDLLSKWCAKEGIEYVAGEQAPLVFYSGFTRSFLAGEQGTSAQWLQKIEARIAELSAGKRVVIVDGVGFPAVGSIVGVDNADVARASRAPVLLVCKSGVGSAVDSFSLNSSYFLAKSVPVLGAVFNLGDTEGFYSSDKCRESIEAWFALQGGRRERFYGVVPKLSELDGLRNLYADAENAFSSNVGLRLRDR
ncbi:bioD [Symbiodinium pilosum]|uniref:BioD protein n=1 Tax=Symbiodinium pilosum TaxID=2952 RepID=A0A812VUK4_SYMPI|nr:bioD [Symbiodinium pilosum]